MIQFIKNSKPTMLLLITGAVYLFLKFMTPLISPVLSAMLFVTIFGSLLQKIQGKLRIHRQVGAGILLFVAGGLFAVLIWVLVYWIINSLPGWIESLSQLEQDLVELIGRSCELVSRATGIDGAYMENYLLGQLQSGFDWFEQKGMPGMFSQSLGYVKSIAGIGAFLVTFVIAAILLAKDYDDIMNRLLDREEYHVVLEVICGIIRYIATYVKAQLIIMMLIGALAAAVLGVSGIRHGVLWGLAAGLLDALPFIGTGIVMVPMALTQLFTGHYVRMVVCLALYGGCALLRECLEPRLIGRRMGIPPIAVLVSLYAGIQLFGAWGILKGPLGFVLIYQTFMSVSRRLDQVQGERLRGGQTADEEDSVSGLTD